MTNDFKKCPVDGCENKIGVDLVACAPHWYRLPSGLRARIYRLFQSQPGGHDHLQAVAEAVQLLNLKPKPKGPNDDHR